MIVVTSLPVGFLKINAIRQPARQPIIQLVTRLRKKSPIDLKPLEM